MVMKLVILSTIEIGNVKNDNHNDIAYHPINNEMLNISIFPSLMICKQSGIQIKISRCIFQGA